MGITCVMSMGARSERGLAGGVHAGFLWGVVVRGVLAWCCRWRVAWWCGVSAAAGGACAAEVRRWAVAEGLLVGARGRIPADVWAAFADAVRAGGS